MVESEPIISAQKKENQIKKYFILFNRRYFGDKLYFRLLIAASQTF